MEWPAGTPLESNAQRTAAIDSPIQSLGPGDSCVFPDWFARAERRLCRRAKGEYCPDLRTPGGWEYSAGGGGGHGAGPPGIEQCPRPAIQIFAAFILFLPHSCRSGNLRIQSSDPSPPGGGGQSEDSSGSGSRGRQGEHGGRTARDPGGFRPPAGGGVGHDNSIHRGDIAQQAAGSGGHRTDPGRPKDRYQGAGGRVRAPQPGGSAEAYSQPAGAPGPRCPRRGGGGGGCRGTGGDPARRPGAGWP